MKKLIIAFIFIASSAFSQVWLSQLGDMFKAIYDTNNDGIVDVSYTSISGPETALYAALAGIASNAIYSEMSFSNSNSIYAEGAGNSVLFDSLPSSYFTNLSNMIGYITTNQVADLADFIQLFASGGSYAPFYTIGNLRISNDLIAHTNSGYITLGNYAIDGTSVVIGQGSTVIDSGASTYIGTNGIGTTYIGGNNFGTYRNFYTTGPTSKIGGLTIEIGIETVATNNSIYIGHTNGTGIILNQHISISNNIISNLAYPSFSNQPATKGYVDNQKNANLVYTLQGGLVAGSNQILVHIPYDLYFGTNMGVAVFDAPTGADIKIDVMLTNTSILTSSNISIVTNTKTALQTLTATQANRFDELSIHIVQVGSTIAGGYLTISIPVRRRD